MLDLAERQSGRWGDLGTRVLSALVLTPIALACVWLGGIAYTLCIAVIALGLVLEWLMLFRRLPSGRPARSPSQEGAAAPGHDVGVAWFSAGLLYVALAGGALLWLRADPVSGRADVLFLLLVVWAGDIGAYMVGRWWGGPRLAPSISPGKTWSGAIGGLLAAVAVGLELRVAKGGLRMLVDAEHLDILQQDVGFRVFALLDATGQQDIDTVAGRHEPGHTGRIGHVDRDGPHAHVDHGRQARLAAAARQHAGEERLARLEMSYRGRQPSEIRVTRFQVVPSGTGYDFKVIAQEGLR